MKKKAVGIILFTFLTVMLTSIPVYARRQSVCPPTSLEVWKVIDDVVRDGDEVTVYGTIFILNDVENQAWIVQIWDFVEAKPKKSPWMELESKDLELGIIILPPGDLLQVPFEITFSAGDYKAYRNVVRVQICNHPNGWHWFHYRISFEVPT